MRQETITFQLATHYLPRIAIRLECLFLTIAQAIEETHPVIHHYALINIIEIIKIIEKPEIKSRFLKEFMRIEHSLNKSQTIVTDERYAALFLQIHQLSYVIGRFGGSVPQDSFIQAIRLAQAAQHHDGELHSPQLLLWLERDAQQRQQDIAKWLKELQPLFDTVNIYLALLRDTAQFEMIDMHNGFYQRSLPSKSLCQLILLRMDKNCGIVPKMQLGHHGLSLRLCDANSMNEIHQTNTMIDLAICQL